MPTVTNTATGRWNVDSLKEYTEALLKAQKDYFEAKLSEKDLRDSQRFEAQEKQVKTAMEAAEKATAKAEAIADQRMAASNEWRAAMKDRESEFASKNDLGSVEKALEALTARYNTSEGRGRGFSQGWGVIALGIATLSALVAIYVALKG